MNRNPAEKSVFCGLKNNIEQAGNIHYLKDNKGVVDMAVFPDIQIEEIRDEVQKVVSGILRMVVNEPSEVSVQCVLCNYRLVFELRTSPDDIGHVIGRRGELISAVRTVIKAIGGNKKVTIDLDYATERENLRIKSAP